MPADVETMMFVGQSPWHGLGTYVGDKEITSSEALQLAGLDWQVELRALQATPEVPVPNYKAVVRNSDNSVLGVVGDRYRPVQNTEAFTFFDDVVGQKQAVYHTAGALGQGRKVWILAKLPGTIEVLGGKDVTEKFLLLSNAHDGSGTLKLFFTPVRVVCQNTLSMALAGFKDADGISIRHTASLDNKVQEAKRVLGFALQYYEGFQAKVTELAATPFTNKQFGNVIKGLLPVQDETEVPTRTENNRNKLAELFENGLGIAPIRGTAWAAYNAVAEYADHYRGSRETDNTAEENRLTAIWYGPAKLFKGTGLTLIEKEVRA